VVYTSGASAIGVPGCPDLARSTASIESVRIVLTDNWSSSVSVIGAAFVILIGCPRRLGLQERDLAQAAQMSRGLAELGGQECLHEIPGHARPHGAATHADDVHVIVLDALPRRKVVMDQRGTDTRHLVGADRGTHA